MKFKPVLILLLLAGCGIGKPGTEISDAQGMLVFQKDDDCLDQRLEHWFIEFNQLQRMGYNMYDANEKAIKVVNAALKDCPKLPDHMASQESRR